MTMTREQALKELSRRDFLRKAKRNIPRFSGLVATGGAVWAGFLRTSSQNTNFGPTINDLKLSKEQLAEDLCIKDSRPMWADSHVQTQGWLGKGMYVFPEISTPSPPFSTPFVTPYLERPEQLDNWYYVLHGRQRVYPIREPHTAAKEIVEAVDRRLGRLRR